jgi:hypothetical protein
MGLCSPKPGMRCPRRSRTSRPPCHRRIGSWSRSCFTSLADSSGAPRWRQFESRTAILSPCHLVTTLGQRGGGRLAGRKASGGNPAPDVAGATSEFFGIQCPCLVGQADENDEIRSWVPPSPFRSSTDASSVIRGVASLRLEARMKSVSQSVEKRRAYNYEEGTLHHSGCGTVGGGLACSRTNDR